MSILLNLMTTLYFDMRMDKADHKENQKLVVKTFKELYKKINIKALSKKKALTFGIFRILPEVSYFIRKTNLTIRRIKNGK